MTSNLNDQLVRPGIDALHEGEFRTLITGARVFSGNKNKQVMLNGVFTNASGETIEESVTLTPEWRPGSTFRKLLELGECLPEPHQPVNLDALVGLTFVIVIRIITKNDRDYANIVGISLPQDDE